MSEQFMKAWSGDLSKLDAAVGSKDAKLVKKLLAADMDVGELVGERGLELEDVLVAIVSGKLDKKHAYVYRRTLELFADVLLEPFADEVTMPGRGWQDLAPAWKHWGAKTLAKFWAGDHGFPWKKNATSWPYAYVLPKKSQKAIAKELKPITAKIVLAKGVPRGIDRFSEYWEMEHLGPEIEGIAQVIRGWCKGKTDVLVWHDGQQ